MEIGVFIAANELPFCFIETYVSLKIYFKNNSRTLFNLIVRFRWLLNDFNVLYVNKKKLKTSEHVRGELIATNAQDIHIAEINRAFFREFYVTINGRSLS